jgi:anti-sigma28 factor (negative regulator of flagellin synthesis)
MKINDQNITASSADRAAGTQAAGLPASGSKDAAGKAASNDHVELSGTSRLLSTASAQRTTRLQSLSAAVRQGRYEVDSKSVSQALVRETAAGRSGK